METSTSRRKFFKGIVALPAIGCLGSTLAFSKTSSIAHKFKLSLNLFSFNALLSDRKVDLYDMLDFCAEHNFDALDPTGYYFPEYPQVPSDEFINEFKRRAFLLGLDISGTGVRNDFTEPDPNKRRAQVELVKKWVEASAKLGIPNLRIFSGNQKNDGYTREQVIDWMVEDVKICCEYGKQHGVIISMQNHNDFLSTADEVNELFERVDSEWLGLNLDIGSYRQKDPYEEIVKNIHHAVTWQIKENVWINDKEQRTDFVKLLKIIKTSGYRGYLPLETLGEGDPYQKVQRLLKEVKEALEQI